VVIDRSRITRHTRLRGREVSEKAAQSPTNFSRVAPDHEVPVHVENSYHIRNVYEILKLPRPLKSDTSLLIIGSLVDLLRGFAKSTKNLSYLCPRLRTIDDWCVLVKVRKQQRVLADALYRLMIRQVRQIGFGKVLQRLPLSAGPRR
jgi:hypothetical protein